MDYTGRYQLVGTFALPCYQMSAVLRSSHAHCPPMLVVQITLRGSERKTNHQECAKKSVAKEAEYDDLAFSWSVGLTRKTEPRLATYTVRGSKGAKNLGL